MRMTVQERIESRIKKEPNGCWLYTGFIQPNGYGQIKVFGKTRLVHRSYWEVVNGPIPKGLCVLHTCDNPPCVNTSHLFLGTHTDNMRDKTKKGRHHNTKKIKCKKWHPYDKKNTYYHTGRRGLGRWCRECDRLRSRRRRL